jgi:hypothetical protein
MNSIQEKLSEKFGKDDIKISTKSQQFNLQQTGQNFFSQNQKKDVQFYVYENDMGLQRISFTKDTRQSLAWLIALSYSQGELGSNLPTNLICISGARNSREKNEDGTFDGVIYDLTKDQIKEITKEYEEIITERDEEQEEFQQHCSDKDWDAVMGIKKDPPPASDYIEYGD